MSLALLVATAAWALSGAAENDPTKQEMKRFQGRWMAVYVEIEGQPIPKEGLNDLKDLEIIIEADRVVLKEDGKVNDGWNVVFKIDPTTNPKTIDISMSLDGAKPKTSLGIYRFDGNTLQICSIAPSKEPERPTTFVTKPGSKYRLWHFKGK